MINFFNTVGPAFQSLIVLYMGIMFVLWFFKRQSLVDRLFGHSFERQFGTMILGIVSFFSLIMEMIIPVSQFRTFTPTGFFTLAEVLILGGVFITIMLFRFLMKLRENIKPE